MSIHPSLGSAAKGKKQRSVLKRTERIRDLLEKGKWADSSTVYGLPKIKMTRLKIKKEKAAEKPEAEAAGSTEAAEAKTESKTAPTSKEKSKT